MEKWIQAIESGLDELFALEAHVLMDGSVSSKHLLFYIRILISYFRQDPESLKDFSQVESGSDLFLKNLIELSKLRSIALMSEPDIEMAKEIYQKFGSDSIETILKAEATFIIAGIHQTRGLFVESERFYREASFLYEGIGARKKSLRALLSSVAAFSCARPDSRLFNEYRLVYKKALEFKENLSMAVALINMSRELQRLDGISAALDHVNEALQLLEPSYHSSREHGLALTHRAHLYLVLKRYADARGDLILALSMNHYEVQAACNTLTEMFQLNLKSLGPARNLPTWKERQIKLEPSRALGRLENELVHLLSQGKKNKYDLMDLIYGDQIDSEARENRFKNLLARVRTRFPGLIYLDGHDYALSEPALKQWRLG